MILLGDRPVFPGVTGRHLIFRLRRGRQENSCRVIDRSQENFDENKSGEDTYRLTHDEIFTGDRVIFERPDRVLASLKSYGELGYFYEVRQGNAENPPFVTRLHLVLLEIRQAVCRARV